MQALAAHYHQIYEHTCACKIHFRKVLSVNQEQKYGEYCQWLNDYK